MKNLSKIGFLILSLAAFTFDDPKGLKIGKKAPLFDTKDSKGKEVDLQKLIKKGSVVLVFYRGYWCPFCNKQLAQLQDSLQLITDKRASVIAISPESGENTEKTIQKTKATFPVVHDTKGEIMKSYQVGYQVDEVTVNKYKGYGIEFEKVNAENGNTLPVPAVYIIDKQGLIKFAYLNPDIRKRTSVADILKNL